ncbi:hypothetical protein KYTH90_05430 [Helicobacter pylori]
MLKALVLWANTKQKAPQKALKSKKMTKFSPNDKKKTLYAIILQIYSNANVLMYEIPNTNPI